MLILGFDGFLALDLGYCGYDYVGMLHLRLFGSVCRLKCFA